MAENTKRSLFGLHGLLGIMISTVGLLTILVGLMLVIMVVYRHASVDYYDPAPIRDLNNLKMISVDNKAFSFVDAKDNKKD